MQKSVFECFLTRQEMQALYYAVENRIDVTEDDVRFYWIPADALPKVLALGSPLPEPPPDYYIV